jgi:hypothetical protein
MVQSQVGAVKPSKSRNPNSQESVYIPNNLNLDFLPASRWDVVRYFVSRLYRGQYVAGNDPDDFQRLYSQLLRKLLGEDYRSGIIRPLLEQNVIEEDRSYLATANGTGYSKSFRLSAPYRNAGFQPILLTDPEQLHRLRRHRVTQLAAYNEPVYIHLGAWLDQLDVLPGYPSDALSLQAIADGNRWFAICRQGRVHTNLTNLQRSHRPFLCLRNANEPLWIIDIKTSQPLLLGVTLKDNPSFMSNSSLSQYIQAVIRRSDMAVGAKAGRTGNKAKHKSQPYVPFYSNDPRTVDQQNEITRYIELCLYGDIYNEFSAMTKYSREQVKKYFLATIYGYPQVAGNNKTGLAFREMFPFIWSMLANINRHDNSLLACLMQTVESWLVIWRTCSRLSAEYPEAPLLTIHDALVTTEAYIERFRQTLSDEFYAVWSIRPKTDIKRLAACANVDSVA